MRHLRPLALTGLLTRVLASASACGRTIDLSKALTVDDVTSGYYDDGLKDGKTHLVPSLTFRLHNTDPDSIVGVQLTLTFWQDGADGELDSLQVTGIGSDALASGASTDPIVARAKVGYSLEGSRADFFTHSLFKDLTAKMFAARGGLWYKLGEFRLERKIIPHTPTT